MKERLKQIYNNSSLTSKIRYSYFLLLVPIFLFLIFCFYNLWMGNRNYNDMINSAVVASEFSLDFKKDYDYETYLLIVGNKTIFESKLDSMLEEANRIVEGLEDLTYTNENSQRLESVQRYLSNLEIYKKRIEQNLSEGNKYEANIEIWENDVQIVTSLLRETIFQYIYYEMRDIQESNSEYQNFFMYMLRIFVFAFVGFVVVIIILSYSIPLSITHPIRKLSAVTDQVAKGNLSVRSDFKMGAEVGMLNDSLNKMIDKINELLEQVRYEQTQLRKAEFEILQAQINPHFLYNTLDTIVWLAESGDQRQVVSMVGSLSEFFRTSLNQGKDFVTIKEELQHVGSYLEIQHVRYQDILEYSITVPKELEMFLIPKITIQPLVENALYHGIKNKRGLGHINITATEREEFYILQVSDNGIGMDERRLKQVREGIQKKDLSEDGVYGLYNVNERIRLNFGEKYGVSIESTYGEGSIVSIVLPFIRKVVQ